MKIDSLYVTQTTMIGLSDLPFDEKSGIDKNFDSIFKSRTCFKDAGIELSHMRAGRPCGRMPYIKNMGQLCFHKRAFTLFDVYSEDEVLPSKRFGYNRDLEDQRKNFLCFCMKHSFKILAQYGGRTMASGKIFLHIYPAGYIAVQLAVYRRDAGGVEIRSEEDILELIRETLPSVNGKWKWKSRFGCFSLRGTLQRVFQSISASLFPGDKEKAEGLIAGNHEWKAGVAMRTDLESEEIRQAILGDKTVEHFEEFQQGEEPRGILTVKKKVHYYFANNGRKRENALHSFWKINLIREFVLYKNCVYGDYLRQIQKDRGELARLTLKRDIISRVSSLVGRNFYKSDFSDHTKVMDQFIQALGTKHGKVYALFSDMDGFSERRRRMNSELEDWKKDISAWNSQDAGVMKLLSVLNGAINLYMALLKLLGRM